MSKVAIEVEGLSKAYQIGQFNTGALAHDLKRWWALSMGKEDPFLKVGETNDRTVIGQSDIVWSLKDLDFKVEQGDAVGIIGRNGAGKSTLLKLLSRVTSPTRGEIRINGRIASLLEVGTGFHPELTGRENVFLNGAILGMRKREIHKRFAEIVEFAGVERYIDTPVKRYSSGMYVRLAFAVAAHLDSEVLIVDEVLAVGDAEFQKKCLGKMGDVSKGEGRTVLFVSHNLGSILQLCDKGIYLKDGELKSIGPVKSVLEKYSLNGSSPNGKYKTSNRDNVKVGIKEIDVTGADGLSKNEFFHSESIFIKVRLYLNDLPPNSSIFLTVVDGLKRRVFSTECQVSKDKDEYLLEIESHFLTRGFYSLHVFTHIPGIVRFDEIEDVCTFSVIDQGSSLHKHGGYDYGVVFGKCYWK